MFSKLQGIGFIAQAIADVLAKDPPDFQSAYNDLMKGLGILNVHQEIVKSMVAQGLDPHLNVPVKEKEKV